MIFPIAAVVFGLFLLVWSADKFVEGASGTAKHFGMPPLLIGMVIVGFGTSAPELVVSVLASIQNNPGIALGNAYGSNITNIALILGLTAIISPITVHSNIVRKELPILLAITALAAYQLWDNQLTRLDSLVLLVVFAGLLGWSIKQGLKQRGDALGTEFEEKLSEATMPLKSYILKTIFGLVLLVIASRFLVWGAIEVAKSLGVSDLIIGLTVVAVGTSLPELASSIIASRKGEHDIALGNIIGSNMFNGLAVVGLAGVINPMEVDHNVLSRDVFVMGLATAFLFLFCIGKDGKITRFEGSLLLAGFVSYTLYLVKTAF